MTTHSEHPAPGAMKSAILAAARTVLIREGFDAWTIEAVAREAGCAKGLVNYHFRSKTLLLAEVARALREDRLRTRLAPLHHRGTEALDALWRAIEEEVATGVFGAWIALLSRREREIVAALRLPPDSEAALGRAATAALEAPHPVSGALLESILSGFQLGLYRGQAAAVLREAYHRFWISLL